MGAVDRPDAWRRNAGVHPSPFLEIPPFPGRRVSRFERAGPCAGSHVTLAQCVRAVRSHRVGGSYWGRQPALPATYYVTRGPAEAELAPEHGERVRWEEPDCDPWHLLGNASAFLCEPDDCALPIAIMLDVPIFLRHQSGRAVPWRDDAQAILARALPVDALFRNPFGGRELGLLDIIELSGFWRALIDSNRSICGGAGFAFWKKASVLPLLWGGGDSRNFFSHDKVMRASQSGAVAVWRSKASPTLIEALEQTGTALVEVEDGFLRSKGLGADCVPPLSITVDRLGAYFDPGQPSELEDMLEKGSFNDDLLERARLLRRTIVDAGLGKYDSSGEVVERDDHSKRHILVAGQVEDDRSILTGGFGLSNLELLRRVRTAHPDAFVIYKPHPDVVAGHRVGGIPEHISRQFADKVVTDRSISSLIAAVDEVHVNTSLAGFEALMRNKDVTTYGVPFYAGWGLTHDLGPVPGRRTARRTLDELVAATLLLYPRYLDPISGLPAPAEIIVDRLTAPTAERSGALINLRRLQGRIKRLVDAWLSK